MFLGYAIVQLPAFFSVLCGCIKSRSKITSKGKDAFNNSLMKMKPEIETDIPPLFRYDIPSKSKSVPNEVKSNF